MTYELTVELHESLPASEAVAAAPLRALLERVLREEQVADDCALTLLLAGDEFLHALNRDHRGVDEPTDVLSFPAAEGEAFPGVAAEGHYLGDIAVAVPLVRRQGAAAGLAPDDELRHVVLHGLLHLLGYDHETAQQDAAMRAREEAVLGPGIHAGRTEDGHPGHE